jgi:hypothetical protein
VENANMSYSISGGGFDRIGTQMWLRLAFAALLSGGAAVAAQNPPPCYGPETFARTGGLPEVFNGTIALPSASVPYVLRVGNGDQLSQNRLSGVTVEVDGVPLFCGADISLATSSVERTFLIDRHSTSTSCALRVVLAGPELGFVTVDVSDFGSAAPIARAGRQQIVPEGTLVQLHGSGSSAPNQGTLAFAWDFVQLPVGSGAVLIGAQTAQPTFLADVAGTYVARLVVDVGLASAVSTTTIHVYGGGNLPPIPDAGSNFSAQLGDSIFLDGSASYDPEGQPLTYSWVLGSRPPGSTATLQGANTVSPDFVGDVVGFYVVNLHVHDGVLQSLVADRVRIEVADCPAANAGVDQTVSAGDTVQLDGSGSCNPEGQQISYFWTFTSVPLGSLAVLGGENTVVPTFVADAEGSYVVELVVFDGIDLSQPDAVTILATSSQANDPDPGDQMRGTAQDDCCRPRSGTWTAR